MSHSRHDQRPINGVVVEPPTGWNPDFPYRDWQASYDKRTPYDQDEIVELLTEYMTLVSKLQVRDPETDGVDPPPQGGHMINEAFWRDKWGRNETVISLMKQMPYSKYRPGGVEIFLSHNTVIADNRDPDGLEYVYYWPWVTEYEADMPEDEFDPPGPILPQDILLTISDRDGDYIFLDTTENTIRILSMQRIPEFNNPPEYPQEYPDWCWHYRNAAARHAPSWLRFRINQIKSLDLIPGVIQNSPAYYVSLVTLPWIWAKMRFLLISEYDWFGDFQLERFAREKQKLWDAAMEE